ncbi:MAG TPA: hypothetical protein PL106_05640, partial [Flavobacteriales bacterium]|nr:hypothetical protein [Flavobacteriales bacterium]
VLTTPVGLTRVKKATDGAPNTDVLAYPVVSNTYPTLATPNKDVFSVPDTEIPTSRVGVPKALTSSTAAGLTT